jgi:integrase
MRQKKTKRPVRFELTEQTRQAVDDYIKAAGKKSGEFLFAACRKQDHRMTTRPYARLLSEWLSSIGLDPHLFDTHSLRKTKATLGGHLREEALHMRLEISHRFLHVFGTIQDDRCGCLGHLRRPRDFTKNHRT